MGTYRSKIKYKIQYLILRFKYKLGIIKPITAQEMKDKLIEKYECINTINAMLEDEEITEFLNKAQFRFMVDKEKDDNS